MAAEQNQDTSAWYNKIRLTRGQFFFAAVGATLGIEHLPDAMQAIEAWRQEQYARNRAEAITRSVNEGDGIRQFGGVLYGELVRNLYAPHGRGVERYLFPLDLTAGDQLPPGNQLYGNIPLNGRWLGVVAAIDHRAVVFPIRFSEEYDLYLPFPQAEPNAPAYLPPLTLVKDQSGQPTRTGITPSTVYLDALTAGGQPLTGYGNFPIHPGEPGSIMH